MEDSNLEQGLATRRLGQSHHSTQHLLPCGIPISLDWAENNLRKAWKLTLESDSSASSQSNMSNRSSWPQLCIDLLAALAKEEQMGFGGCNKARHSFDRAPEFH